MNPKPYTGQIVHYVSHTNGKCLAAVIVDINRVDTSRAEVTLYVFKPDIDPPGALLPEHPILLATTIYDHNNRDLGTWHFCGPESPRSPFDWCSR